MLPLLNVAIVKAVIEKNCCCDVPLLLECHVLRHTKQVQSH
jgi:hypothetical protein